MPYNSNYTGASIEETLAKVVDAQPATESAAGNGGLLPAPPAGSDTKALLGNMTWTEVAKPSDIPSVDTIAMNHAKFLSNTPKTVTTLANLPIDTHNIIANVSAATSISVTPGFVNGRDLQIRVNNTTSSVITQPIPTTGNYDCLDGTSVEIPANGFIELNIWYINSKYVIRVGQKQ